MGEKRRHRKGEEKKDRRRTKEKEGYFHIRFTLFLTFLHDCKSINANEKEEEDKKWRELEKRAEEKIKSLVHQEEEKSTLDVDEVKRRLRQKNSPVTLFGETDIQREKRLRKLEEMAEQQKGQTNIFGELMEELESGEKNYNRDKKILAEMLPKEDSNNKQDILMLFYFVNLAGSFFPI